MGGQKGARRVRMHARRVAILTLGIPALVTLTGCAGVLDPAGDRSEPVADIWWVMLGIATAVCVLVAALTLIAVAAPGRSRLRLRGRGPSRLILLGGVILPVVVVVPLFAWALVVDLRVLAEEDDELVVQVTGHRFWWEVHYPGEGITTANEIHIPVGRAVRVELNSDDVIHSFWIPELGGKADLIPGRSNQTYIEASEPGRFRGQCAEFCGIQHARMRLLVVAHPSEEFGAWQRGQSAPGVEPDESTVVAGRDVFIASGCGRCHTVQGQTGATGEVGPDLTHLASRSTIAAGTLPNDRGNLAGWVLNPQDLKPGALMPATELSAEELRSLLDYLQALE